MILGNSSIDYSQMLLFMFGSLVHWKIEPNSRAFSRFRQHLVYDLITNRLWHMPHGIALLATPKNGNNYYLLLEQPSSRRFHAQSCVSSSLCSSSQTSAPLESPLAATLTN